MQLFKVRRDAVGVELSDGIQNRKVVVTIFLQTANQRVRLSSPSRGSHPSQNRLRPNLKQQFAARFGHRVDAGTEANRLANVLRPVFAVELRVRVEDLSRYVTNER